METVGRVKSSENRVILYVRRFRYQGVRGVSRSDLGRSQKTQHPVIKEYAGPCY